MDKLISAADQALRTLFSPARATRACPTRAETPSRMTVDEKQLSGALMRVNHVGEVCAQALYSAQALTTTDASLRQHFERAAQDEADHLAWTAQRLQELGARPSWLNPLWYAGAFGIGLVAGRLGDAASLGFLVETERQVEAHLAGHESRLPEADHESRAIVAQMKLEEARHALDAQRAGALEMPAPAKAAMTAAAKLMTSVAFRI